MDNKIYYNKYTKTLFVNTLDYEQLSIFFNIILKCISRKSNLQI